MATTGTTRASARAIAVAIEAHSADMANAVEARVSRLANEAEKAMRRGAPADQSTLIDAIKTSFVAQGHYRIDVGVDYGAAVDEGRKPGKGLPWLDSPGALGVLGWMKRRQGEYLRTFAGPVTKAMRRGMALKPKKGSKLADAREADLRTRYFAFSRSVKRKGIKANPFFTRVVQRLEREMPQVLAETAQAAVARANHRGLA